MRRDRKTAKKEARRKQGRKADLQHFRCACTRRAVVDVVQADDHCWRLGVRSVYLHLERHWCGCRVAAAVVVVGWHRPSEQTHTNAHKNAVSATRETPTNAHTQTQTHSARNWSQQRLTWRGPAPPPTLRASEYRRSTAPSPARVESVPPTSHLVRGHHWSLLSVQQLRPQLPRFLLPLLLTPPPTTTTTTFQPLTLTQASPMMTPCSVPWPCDRQQAGRG